MENADVARILDEVADLLDIQGANPFRVRAYRNAARTVGSLTEDVASMVLSGRALEDLPGIGKDLAGKIEEVVRTGDLSTHAELLEQVPRGLLEVMSIQGIGPKKARLFFEKAGVTSVEDLEDAAKEGRLRDLPGMGARSQEKIVKGIEEFRARAGRFEYATAEIYARAYLKHLKGVKGIIRMEMAGSFRRRRETVGDLDLLVTAEDARAVSERFVGYHGVREVVARGETKSSVVLESGLNADLRVVDAESFGAALHYFTGSKAHNIAIRALGLRLGLKINEYGIFRGEERIGGQDEVEVFRAVGLPPIPPELREDRGEIDAAREGRLPVLVEGSDIRGDLQVHSVASDGKMTVEDIAAAAERKGYEYIAITDHSKAVTVARGLDAGRLREQGRAIRKIQRLFPRVRILRSIEVDILEKGRLDLPDDALRELDLVVAAVHSRFNLSRAEMTERIIRAMENPYVDIIGHPSGRLLSSRSPYELDWERLMDAAREHGVVLELNAHPERLDLDDIRCRMAKERGVRIVISTDAHSLRELDCMEYGIGQARRGWIEASDVLNALPLEGMLGALRRNLR